jgi:methylmalonyl-CoA mutase cobalamin-binding subunit
VAISVTAAQHRMSTARVVEALRRSHVKAPIFIGGAGVGERDAVRVGADQWVPDVESLIEVLRTR